MSELAPSYAEMKMLQDEVEELRNELRQSKIELGQNVRNLLEAAALCDDREKAVAMIAKALQLEYPSALEKRMISWQQRWEGFHKETRLAEIFHWITAECYQCMKLVQAENPKDVVGTND